MGDENDSWEEMNQVEEFQKAKKKYTGKNVWELQTSVGYFE